RKSEFLLHDAEFLASLAAVSLPAYEYPHAKLHRAWELVCLNQFHDIIPGSSIGEVYVDSQRQYAEVRALGERVRDDALAQLSTRLVGEVVVVNPTSFTRRDLAFWPGGLAANEVLLRPDGVPVLTQAAEDGTWLDLGALPPYSLTSLTSKVNAAHVTPVASTLAATPALLENDFLRVEFNSAGDITRIFDKRHAREVLPPGELANQFQLFEDLNPNFDAWNLDPLYEDKRWLAPPAETVRVVTRGPLRATLEVRRQIRQSELVQRISLTRQSPRLDFETTVEWRERHLLLKVAFPVQVLAPKATYEIQWGNVERPTHRNTSWDWARFETAAQKWVDLSEGGYGVSLLNDCKYGHDIHANVIRLSLLRGTTAPDPEADQGEHHFTYSLLPHAGGWDQETVAAAYALNDPLLVHPLRGEKNNPRSARSFVATEASNAVIETIKGAEDGRGVIVRLYESQRRRGKVTLDAGFPLREVWRTNLLEENQEQLACTAHSVTISLRPYQIVTLRLLV
ncbi:MAG: glycoside hydrolase family 38 C-terminal domain-containing protein, partial [Chloroflexota bacterium]|nr:glycoside hydrolase family 38 C-terminal domain-containing protein [Chloroflexota bacterium]